jgi:hypothetical protein
VAVGIHDIDRETRIYLVEAKKILGARRSNTDAQRGCKRFECT